MRQIFFITLISVAVLAPALAFALPQPTGVIGGQLVPTCAPNCAWADLVKLASNILNFLVFLSIMAAALMFSYAGFLYMSDGGSMNKVKEAHSVFAAVAVGIIIVLVAWLAVDTLMKTLTGKGIKEWSNQSSSLSEPLQRSV